MINAAVIGVSGFGAVHLSDLIREHEAGRLNFAAAVIHQNQVSPENLERIKALNVEIFTELNNRMVNISFAQPTALNFDGLFQKEIDNYVDAILGKAECLAPAQDGVEMMKILDAVYESALTGHEVIL